MSLNPIALAIPVFFGAIFVEHFVARRKGLKVYRFVDAVTDLSCGVGNQVMGLLFGAALLAVYAFIWEHHRLVTFEPGSPWPWVLAIVGVDFIYYWWHRLSHEVNVLWAAHVVHHQSEDYNLAVALRQALFTNFTGLPFYLPLALLGVPPLAYATSIAVSLLYQFFIHTEVVGRLPAPVERVFNTPSHHRVHHATNPQYLDKNYGAILIVWDRLFGTFEPEDEPCTYGITKPLGSFNPVWANLQYFGEIHALSKRAKGLRNKLFAIVARPGWNPQTGRVELPGHREQFEKFDVPPPSRPMFVWVVVQFALVAVGLVALLLWGTQLPVWQRWVAGALVMVATVAWGGLFERKSWARPLEAARLVATGGFLAVVAAGF